MISQLSPTQLKALCQKYDLTPSKQYGQNYLISSAPVERMIEAGELTPSDTVVEIGPGFGVLTCAIAPMVARVVAFEIEQKLRGYWEEKQKEYATIDVVWGNALKEISLEKYDIPLGYKVLANLPYQITSHAIRTLLELEQKPERIIIMVQKEVAERICAVPGDMSLLAVSVQYYGEPKMIAMVPSGNFWPPPKVDSAVVAITNIQEKKGAEEFFRFVRAGFQNKRKQLWKNVSVGLGLDGSVVKRVLLDVVGNEKVRAEELSVGEWEQVIARLIGE